MEPVAEGVGAPLVDSPGLALVSTLVLARELAGTEHLADSTRRALQDPRRLLNRVCFRPSLHKDSIPAARISHPLLGVNCVNC